MGELAQWWNGPVALAEVPGSVLSAHTVTSTVWNFSPRVFTSLFRPLRAPGKHMLSSHYLCSFSWRWKSMTWPRAWHLYLMGPKWSKSHKVYSSQVTRFWRRLEFRIMYMLLLLFICQPLHINLPAPIWKSLELVHTIYPWDNPEGCPCICAYREPML